MPQDMHASPATIPVKKEDGTTVRMTLEQLRIYQKQQKQQSVGSLASPSNQVKTNSLQSIAQLTERLKQGAIARPVPPKAQSTPAKKESTLTLHAVQKKLSPIAIDAGQQVNDVATAKQEALVSQKSAVPALRTKSMALSTTTPVPNAFIQEAVAHIWDKDDHVSLLDETLHQDFLAPAQPLMTATAAGATAKAGGQSAVPVQTSSAQFSDTTMRQSLHTRTSIQDVQPKKIGVVPRTLDSTYEQTKTTMGPLDELAQFTVIDFRRLSKTPMDAAAQILKKFDILKQESYLLYLDARQAWWKSPLYTQYIALMTSALLQLQPITELYGSAGDTEQLMQEEYEAIIAINRRLN